MKIAVFLSSRSILGREGTGSGTYDKTVADFLSRTSIEEDIEYAFLVPSQARLGILPLRGVNGSVYEYSLSFCEALVAFMPNSGLLYSLLRSVGSRLERKLRALGFGAAYFAGPSRLAMLFEETPYVYTVWDLGHRDLPGLREVWRQSEWRKRESVYSVAVPRSSFVLTDSDRTGRRLENLYGLSHGRWQSAGLIPENSIDLQCSREFSFPYIIYPAARWPHKNHLTLFRALKLVLEHAPTVKLILTGKSSKYSAFLSQQVRSLGIEESVIDLGEVPRERLHCLTRYANALVMPSLLGPTNFPPLEALTLGVSTIVSDAHDMSELSSKSVSVATALDPDEWASRILEILENPRSQDPATFPRGRVESAHRRAFQEVRRTLDLLGEL